MNLRSLLRIRRGAVPSDGAFNTGGESSVIRPMPRRKVTHSIGDAHVALPMARRVHFKAGIIRPIRRLFVWLWGLVRFYFGNLIDLVLGRASVERRAIRLRRVFEDAGPTRKATQQLSMRADMLPYAYCTELAKMLDQAPAFPSDQAIAIIERNLGKPLADVFEAFDPQPIGAASLACVYQAQLRTGDRVAVKVRRPGIGPLIAADLRAMDWLLIVAETLTVIPPGVTRRFREDFQTILFNEMNFRTEARYTDLFRRRAAKRKKGVTAPHATRWRRCRPRPRTGSSSTRACGDARDPRVGRGLVGHAADGRRPGRAESSAPAPGTTCMHQNVTVAVAVVLSCFRLEPPAEPDRLRRGRVPVGALPAPGAARARRSRSSRTWTRCSRRSTSARCSSRVSHVLFKTAELQDVDGGPAPRRGGRRARPARRVPVGGRGAARRRRGSASPSPPAARSSGCAAVPGRAGCTSGRT